MCPGTPPLPYGNIVSRRVVCDLFALLFSSACAYGFEKSQKADTESAGNG